MTADIIDFTAKKAERDFLKTKVVLATGEVRFRCLVCKQYWNQEEPEGMKKVNCPKCGLTMLKYSVDK